MAEETHAIIPASQIINRIFILRGQKVMLDEDLAELYGVRTWNITRAVSRHGERFPDEFSFQLSGKEFEDLKRQFGASRSWGGRRRSTPRAFTQEGVAMLSSVLTSKQAIQINILIIKAFVRMRELLETNAVLREKLSAMERQLGDHSQQLRDVYAVLQKLLDEPVPPKNPMGFGTGEGG